MAVTFLQSELVEALSPVVRVAASSRSVITPLSGVLVECDESCCTLQATNLEVAMKSVVNASSKSEPFSVLPPAKLFYDVVSSVPSGVVSLAVEGYNLIVQSGMYRSVIKGYYPKEFPKLEFCDGGAEVDGIVDAIARVAPFASTDDSRVTLESVYLSARDGKLYVTATDGFRFASKYLPAGSIEIDAIIPVEEVKRTISSLGNRMSVLGNGVCFSSDSGSVLFTTIGSQYPDVMQVVPQCYRSLVKISKPDFVSALKRAYIIARDSANMVVLDVTDKEVTIKASSIDTGDCVETVSVSAEGEGVTIGFNAKYLLDAVQAVETDTVHMDFVGPNRPAVLRNDSDDSFLAVLMPMQLK